MNKAALSLYELNNLIRGVLEEGLPDTCWVRAEMSDVRVNQNGHCYLEFIEKDEKGKTLLAKLRGTIWANTFLMLKAYFESATKQTFASGLKVLVKVSVEFHELYGLSLAVHDIDPSYTLGDQALNRTQILKRLEDEGVLNMNKELELPMPANRIAVISSPTAAGYEDFLHQLEKNSYGFIFYTKLFPAIMQGDRAEQSIIESLEAIYEHVHCFDAVVVIRGGGATSDLSCFDSYLLAANCAQFPLPIITGIGHERDETVLDFVAHTRAKTPTAVAEFLIGNVLEEAMNLSHIAQNITLRLNEMMQNETQRLSLFQNQCASNLKSWNKQQTAILAYAKNSLEKGALHLLERESIKMDSFEKHLQLASPENILKKGYTLTFKGGTIVKNIAQLSIGDEITTLFGQGEIKSIVK